MRQDSAAGMSPEKKFVSPTQLTNSARRPKSSRRSARDLKSVSSFHPDSSGQSRSVDDGRNGAQRGKPLPALADSIGACNSPKTNDELKEAMERAREVVYEQARVAGPVARDGVNGCIDVTRKYAKAPNKQDVKTCLRSTRSGQLEFKKWVCHAYDVVQTECHIPQPRREDFEGLDMFSKVTQSTTPIRNTRRSTRSKIRNARPRKSARGLVDHSPEPIPEEPPEIFRSSKGMRFPQAARIENPDDRRDLGLPNDDDISASPAGSTTSSPDDGSRQQPSDEEAVEDEESEGLEGLEDLPDYDDQPRTMMDYRLRLFEDDDRSSKKTVPKCRLSRALNELSHQDGAIQSLEKTLDETQASLGITEKELISAREISEKQKNMIIHLRSEASKEATALEEKLAEESNERSKLQSKVSGLQVEISRLRSALRAAKTDAKRRGDKYCFEQPGAESPVVVPDYDDDAESLKTEQSSIEVALRAEVVNLKAELAEAKADLLQSGPAITGGRAELIRLRSKLQICEAELTRLRLNEAREIRASNPLIAPLEQSLKKKEEELKLAREGLDLAKAVESELRDELADAKAKILALEKEKASSHLTKIAEVEQLRIDLAAAHQDLADARKEKVTNVEHRNEKGVDQLKVEVKSLAKKLSDSARQAVLAVAEHMKERQSLEAELNLSKKSILDMQQTVQMMREQLSRTELNERQIITRGCSVEGRSVKRKLDDDLLGPQKIATRVSGESSELTLLRGQLSEARSSEEKLNAEMAVLKDLLKLAEATAAETKAEAQEEVQELKEKEGLLASAVHELEQMLHDAERKALSLAKEKVTLVDKHSRVEHELQSSRVREKSLLNDVRILKTNLEHAERRYQEEKKHVEEERSRSRMVEAERLEDVEKLRQQIRGMSSSPGTDRILLQRVRDLEFRLALAEAEAEQQKIDIEYEKRIDPDEFKRRTDSAVSKARLATSKKVTHSPRSVSTGTVSAYILSSHDSLSTGYGYMDSPGGRSLSLSPPLTPSRAKTFNGENCSSKSPVHRFAQHVPAAKDEKEDVPHDEVDEPVLCKPRTSRRKVDIEGLERRLHESNQRLEDANVRLKDITSPRGERRKEQSKVERVDDPLLNLVDKQAGRWLPDSPVWNIDDRSIESSSSQKCGSVEEWRMEHGEI